MDKTEEENKTNTVTFTEEQVNKILQCLGKQKCEDVFETVLLIHQVWNEQH